MATKTKPTTTEAATESTELSEAPTTMATIRQRILDGQSVTVPEYTAARASAEFVELIGDLAGQRKAALEAAELERQRAEFTAAALDDPLLAAGAAIAAASQLQEAVSGALTLYLDHIGQVNAAIHAAVVNTRELDLIDDVARAVHYRGGVQSGLVVNGSRIEPATAWHRTAASALSNALAQARRTHR